MAPSEAPPQGPTRVETARERVRFAEEQIKDLRKQRQENREFVRQVTQPYGHEADPQDYMDEYSDPLHAAQLAIEQAEDALPEAEQRLAAAKQQVVLEELKEELHQLGSREISVADEALTKLGLRSAQVAGAIVAAAIGLLAFEHVPRTNIDDFAEVLLWGSLTVGLVPAQHALRYLLSGVSASLTIVGKLRGLETVVAGPARLTAAASRGIPKYASMAQAVTALFAGQAMYRLLLASYVVS